MTHYQKIATLIFRIIAVLAMLWGLISWLIVAVTTFFVAHTTFLPSGFIVPGLYLVSGIIMFSLSRFLAAWVCLDFDEFRKN